MREETLASAMLAHGTWSVEAELALLGVRLCAGGCEQLVTGTFCPECLRLYLELEARHKAATAYAQAAYDSYRVEAGMVALDRRYGVRNVMGIGFGLLGSVCFVGLTWLGWQAVQAVWAICQWCAK